MGDACRAGKEHSVAVRIERMMSRVWSLHSRLDSHGTSSAFARLIEQLSREARVCADDERNRGGAFVKGRVAVACLLV